MCSEVGRVRESVSEMVVIESEEGGVRREVGGVRRIVL